MLSSTRFFFFKIDILIDKEKIYSGKKKIPVIGVPRTTPINKGQIIRQDNLTKKKPLGKKALI
jgi:hypothetical protein